MPVTLAHLKSQIKSEREDVGFQENPEFETSTKYLSQSRSYEGQFHTKKVKSVDFEAKKTRLCWGRKGEEGEWGDHGLITRVGLMMKVLMQSAKSSLFGEGKWIKAVA
ncbi:hypothetical protein L2E82_11817 [Cichorium intybus]|uniref:Uncharacterized protein n=1 Tax=Cichorium intybus TaxID=13427 RepID=A0ACB9GE86_CICIN|nr:hypothetical protein L2E82_11817 [Cichorium intybus]